MKYAGPSVGKSGPGFVGVQMGNPSFELYAYKSDLWIGKANYNGIQTNLSSGNWVLTFFDRSTNKWVSTYETTAEDFAKRAASFLKPSTTSYEPGFDQTMEDSEDTYDWSSYDDAVDEADLAAIGC